MADEFDHQSIIDLLTSIKEYLRNDRDDIVNGWKDDESKELVQLMTTMQGDIDFIVDGIGRFDLEMKKLG
jgi:hypothetical protein